MKLKLLAATLLAAASFGASAADQTVTLTTTPVLGSDNTFAGSVNGADGLLSGGLDIISFDGLASGMYTIKVTLSGQNVLFDDTLSKLYSDNSSTGASGTFTQVGPNAGEFSFYSVALADASPFSLHLYGTAFESAIYSGTVTISAVPEPETYGMMLGGLGLISWLGRRKKKQAA